MMSVVFKKWQFSSMTDPRDRQLTTWPATNDPSWRQCLSIACASIDGDLPNPVPGADHYYDISIPPPKWAAAARFVSQIGKVRFYDLERD
ncbi:MAG TPA: hypothetical protein DDY20_05760 [Desulfobulbaceae bacterium]|nr:hypothetical protein [Desulfobulbaceae bacterium]